VKNIFLFIRNYFTLLCFVVLQITSLVMLSKSSDAHDAFFSSAINEVTGKINKQYNGFYEYFSLKEVNRQLVAENAALKNKLNNYIIAPDSTQRLVVDSTVTDTIGRYRKFTFLPATVIGNNITLQNNFLTLERGSLQGVKKGMSVISPQGIVGSVIDVSDNMCRVMSVLHRSSKVSAMLKKDNNAGSIEWDGENPEYLTLKNIPKSAKITIGDTVVTSNYSANSPAYIPVGTIAGKTADPASNFYTLKVKTATNFASVQQVYLIKNVRFAEQTAIEAKVMKINE